MMVGLNFDSWNSLKKVSKHRRGHKPSHKKSNRAKMQKASKKRNRR